MNNFKRIRLLGLIIAACFLRTAVWAEEITITTYYPSPYGSYNTLNVNELNVINNLNLKPGSTLRVDLGGGVYKTLFNIDAAGNLTFPNQVFFDNLMLLDTTGAGYNDLRAQLQAAEAYDNFLFNWVTSIENQLVLLTGVAILIAAAFAPIWPILVIMGAGSLPLIAGFLAAASGPAVWWP